MRAEGIRNRGDISLVPQRQTPLAPVTGRLHAGRGGVAARCQDRRGLAGDRSPTAPPEIMRLRLGPRRGYRWGSAAGDLAGRRIDHGDASRCGRLPGGRIVVGRLSRECVSRLLENRPAKDEPSRPGIRSVRKDRHSVYFSGMGWVARWDDSA